MPLPGEGTLQWTQQQSMRSDELLKSQRMWTPKSCGDLKSLDFTGYPETHRLRDLS